MRRLIVPDHVNKLHKHYTYAHILEDEHLPFYIGLGTQVKKSTLFSRALSTTGRNVEWWKKIKDNNYLVIICTSSDDYEAEKLKEIDVISTLGRNLDDGLLVNIAKGGNGCKGYKHTEEHKQKLRIRYTGESNPMYGKKSSEETRKKMSNSQKGRKHSDKTKNILREKAIKRGYVGPVGRSHGRSRVVYKIDPITKEKLEKFYTLIDASNSVGCSSRAIGNSCKYKHKTKNYLWEYGEK